MNNFSILVSEAQRETGGDELSAQDLSQYISKCSSKLPSIIQNILYLTKKYQLLSKEDLEKIRVSNNNATSYIADLYHMDDEDVVFLRDSLKKIGKNIKLLPQYQLKIERSSFMKGKIKPEDLTIDIETPSGRNQTTKMYMPLVYKIVNQYVGKSRLSRQDLISAALVGFTYALDTYGTKLVDKDSDSKERIPDEAKTTFKTYASYCVQHQILNDINKYGHTLSGTNWYASNKYGASLLDATSLDGMSRDDDGEFNNDHLRSLGTEDPEMMDRDEQKKWQDLYDLIEKNFSQRNVNIFYRYFGLNGYKREKSKDIAKSMGMSEGNIRNSIINKMIDFLRKDRRATDILSDIQDIYNESLMVSMVSLSREEIMETLINDDIYILLEELNRWKNKNVFAHALYLAFENISNDDIKIITPLLSGDFNVLDDSYKKNKKVIMKFLKEMYPTENISRKSDVSLLEMMSDVQEAYKRFGMK